MDTPGWLPLPQLEFIKTRIQPQIPLRNPSLIYQLRMVSRRTPWLPDKIYLINAYDDCYYSLKEKTGTVTVEKTTSDPFCEVTVEYLLTNPDEFYLKTRKGGYFQFHKHHKRRAKENHIVHSPTSKFPKRAIPFTMLDLGDSEPDTFVLRAVNGKFLVLMVNEKNRVVLGDFADAKIRIGNPAIKKLISNIDYYLESSTINDITPEIALKTAVRNDSKSDSTKALAYLYLVSHTGSWTNSIGVALPSEAVAGVKIPCLVDGEIITAENYSHIELYSKVDTKTATSSVSVPASTRGVATVLIYKALIEVPFSYTETVWYQCGECAEMTKYGM